MDYVVDVHNKLLQKNNIQYTVVLKRLLKLSLNNSWSQLLAEQWLFRENKLMYQLQKFSSK